MSNDEAETRVVRDQDGSEGLRLPGIVLSVVEGPDRGREVVARRGVVRVGSASDNDLALTDDSVSRHHFELTLRANDVRVVDLGSTNGTRVDGVGIVEAILSPASLIRIGATVIRASAVEEAVIVPLSTRERFGSLLGRSVAMREVFAVLERAAPTDATVLIEGETGTGKELAAEAIHQHSARKEGAFVTVDCGAVAAQLIESELFGHVRGAFTGAIADRRGVFEEAHGGTLFLDEIGELPLELQPKLLRALEKREIRRVGASQSRQIDVRVVAATNRDLVMEVNRGAFREDLFYRLAVVRIRLPPLRGRREDIALLAQHFVDCFASGSGPLSPEMLRALASRPWPGNVRELRNAVQRAIALSRSPGAPSEQSAEQSLEVAPPPGGPAAPDMSQLFALPFKDAVGTWTEAFERAYLEHALRVSGGSVSGAARIAGVNRRFVQRAMRRHGMRATDDDDEL